MPKILCINVSLLVLASTTEYVKSKKVVYSLYITPEEAAYSLSFLQSCH